VDVILLPVDNNHNITIFKNVDVMFYPCCCLFLGPGCHRIYTLITWDDMSANFKNCAQSDKPQFLEEEFTHQENSGVMRVGVHDKVSAPFTGEV
jgi:hypothetical protein